LSQRKARESHSYDTDQQEYFFHGGGLYE